MSGTAIATPSIFMSSSAYWTGRLAVVLISSVPPERVKMISALRFCERRARSFDSPRASPVKSITRHTPSATPAALTTARTGRWRTLAVTRLSISFRGRGPETGGCLNSVPLQLRAGRLSRPPASSLRPLASPLLLRVQIDLGQARGVLQDENLRVVGLVHLD